MALFRRWAGPTGLRSTLRAIGANSGCARVDLLRAPLGRTSLRPAEPAHPRCQAARLCQSSEAPGSGSTSSGRPAKERDAKEGGYACRSPGHWDGTPDALRQGVRLLDRVRRGRERPTLGEPPAGASPALGCRAARKGIDSLVLRLFLCLRYFRGHEGISCKEGYNLPCAIDGALGARMRAASRYACVT